MTANPNRALLLVALLVLALECCAAVAPLSDPSEARYASIAQHMVLSGNWLVPAIDRGDGFIPFWGKPPLHIWLTALSLQVFGFTEFAARIPSFLSFCGVIILGMIFAKRRLSRGAASIFPFAMLASPIPAALSISCLIDSSFTFWITLALISFALTAGGEENRLWAYAFFVALGAAFLTKGPLAFALTGFVIAVWVLLFKRWDALKRLPWLSGTLIVLVMVVPWFVLAEQASPGLVRYFFLNENVLRYISPDYEDLYGTSHRTFRGVIVCYFLLSLVPVMFAVFARLLLDDRRLRDGSPGTPSFRIRAKEMFQTNSSCAFLALWGLAPVLIFLPSNNVLVTYCLPGISGVLLLFSEILARAELTASGSTPASPSFRFNTPALAGAMCGGLFLAAVWSTSDDSLSTRALIRSLSPEKRDSGLMFYEKLPYSALFYLQADPAAREKLPTRLIFDAKATREFLIQAKQIKRLPPEVQERFELRERIGTWSILAPKAPS